MMLLGLDLASKTSGFCVGDGAQVPTADVWRFPEVTDEHGADYGALLDALYQNLNTVLDRFQVEAVAYEAPIKVPIDTLAKLRLLYPLGAFVEWVCRQRDIPCGEFTVQEVKAEVTGNANASKEDIAFVAEKCGVVLPKVGRLDAGDAWAVWKRLLRHYDPKTAARWDSAIYGSRGGLL